MSTQRRPPTRTLLDVQGAADYLATSPRFVRRLVAERRIRFFKVGRHIRLATTDLDDFVESGRVDAMG